MFPCELWLVLSRLLNWSAANLTSFIYLSLTDPLIFLLRLVGLSLWSLTNYTVVSWEGSLSSEWSRSMKFEGNCATKSRRRLSRTLSLTAPSRMRSFFITLTRSRSWAIRLRPRFKSYLSSVKGVEDFTSYKLLMRLSASFLYYFLATQH